MAKEKNNEIKDLKVEIADHYIELDKLAALREHAMQELRTKLSELLELEQKLKG